MGNIRNTRHPKRLPKMIPRFLASDTVSGLTQFVHFLNTNTIYLTPHLPSAVPFAVDILYSADICKNTLSESN